MTKIIALVLVLLTTGCTGTTGALLGSLFGAGAMYGGQAFLNRAQEDVGAKILHRAERQKIVDAAAASKRRRCESLQNSLMEFTCWKELLAFHDTQNPETLVMELKRRLEGINLTGLEKARRQRIEERFKERKGQT